MGTGGTGGTSHVHDLIAALAVLFGTMACGLVLTWSAVSSVPGGTGQTALSLVVCGLAQAELARRHASRATRQVDTPGVPTVSVWVVGAALTLPLPLVLVVSSVLHTHDLVRGPRGGAHLRRVVAGTVGATLAWSVSSGGVLGAVLGGLLYLVVTDGPALVRATRSLLRRESHRAVGDAVACAALGVLLGLFAHVSPLAILFVLAPVAHLNQAARGRALRYVAAHDPKTRLWNHSAWQALSSAALASPRTRARSAVLMVDLDHFKRLNDTHGHHAGDDVLTSVAHVLRTSTRRNDIVARFGGEEFSILLPGVTEQEACQVAERIRDQIAALTVITTNLHGRPTTISDVTASIGVATTDRADTSVDDLLVNADRWLYQAKERGRNRVCGPVLAAA
ncbi:GGDEF domain-containing protein [Actinophytocola oryzae]|uniref:Diguanylate cyclase (GGDEF)-like protein n=1 Tax=Actinophytocola oryzae TaxID=502181 RepID=A0A4V3FV48_9PSEU|nr:GGDEF domain-containing protein [Actinophytocola oryzae]TDV57811.1 diguanylate cyclase (GGDEF)-like protein [Actinophytocola oryzae]